MRLVPLLTADETRHAEEAHAGPMDELMERAGTSDRGLLTIEPERLNADVARAAAGGIAVAIHAIGDRAVRAALDGIEPTRAAQPDLRHPHTLDPHIVDAAIDRRTHVGRDRATNLTGNRHRQRRDVAPAPSRTVAPSSFGCQP